MYIYIHIYVCVHSYICVHIYTYVYLYLYLYTHIEQVEGTEEQKRVIFTNRNFTARSNSPTGYTTVRTSGVLQRVAACCSVLQRVAACCTEQFAHGLHHCSDLGVLHSVALCCSVLQHVAVSCSMQRHVVAC